MEMLKPEHTQRALRANFYTVANSIQPLSAVLGQYGVEG